jgi:hypothetical protein
MARLRHIAFALSCRQRWELSMTNANTSLSTEDANRFRAFERQRRDNLATSYRYRHLPQFLAHT